MKISEKKKKILHNLLEHMIYQTPVEFTKKGEKWLKKNGYEPFHPTHFWSIYEMSTETISICTYGYRIREIPFDLLSKKFLHK